MSGASGSLPSVLVADDDPSMRELIVDILSGLGVETKQAAGGGEAIVALSGDLPNLVILDLSMPDNDGFEVLSFLRKREATVPTIVVTAHEDIPTLRRAIGLGASDYVVKPFRNAQLALRASRLLGRYV